MSIILKSHANIEFKFVVALYSEALPIIEYYNLPIIGELDEVVGCIWLQFDLASVVAVLVLHFSQPVWPKF